MKIGMSLPLMEPGLDRDRLIQWLDRLEQGPFSSVALGERIAFFNLELLTTLGACALHTSRLELITTVSVATLHNPVLLAKQLATVDVLSNGRLQVGLGVGGREEDYLAAGTPLSQRRHSTLASRVQTMRDVWQGDYLSEGAANPVGPQPVQKHGPALLAGALGPKAMAKAAEWADGITGFSFGPDLKEIADSFALARQCWQDAGRDTAPRLLTSFWYALDNAGGREQLQQHLRRYLSWMEPSLVESLLPGTGFTGSAQALRGLLKELADLGTEEVILTPTSTDPDEVSRISDIIAGL